MTIPKQNTAEKQKHARVPSMKAFVFLSLLFFRRVIFFVTHGRGGKERSRIHMRGKVRSFANVAPASNEKPGLYP